MLNNAFGRLWDNTIAFISQRIVGFISRRDAKAQRVLRLEQKAIALLMF
ncbi:MAG: hypothetical protein RLZZ74_657 [Cyanobacteriota bacterium]